MMTSRCSDSEGRDLDASSRFPYPWTRAFVEFGGLVFLGSSAERTAAYWVVGHLHRQMCAKRDQHGKSLLGLRILSV